MATGVIIGISVYLVGYLLCFILCTRLWKQYWWDAVVISFASWGIFILYAIHVVYNYFHKEEE